ncbi:MAG: hypothetical protein LBC52_03325 [Treponema sp.]|jgi:hypothetical protein|nr:hypothetical protein [Treponema sp.]
MASYSKLKIYALAAVIVFFLASCGTAGKKNVNTFLDGSWWNTGENDNCRLLMDGNTWTYYIDNIPTYKGTWTASVEPAADARGTITFTITHVELKQGWVDLSVEHKKIKSCIVEYSIDAEAKQVTLTNKRLADFDPTGIWKRIEGVYIKGRPDGSKPGSDDRSGDNGASSDGKAGDGSKASKTPSKTIVEEKPYIPYVITGSGTSFAVIKNGYLVVTANQTLNDAIDAVKKDSAGFNASIKFGYGTGILDIGSSSLRFDPHPGDSGIMALSGKITSSASPVIVVNSAIVSSSADITTTNTGSGGSIIDNNGTIIINGGTVASNSANIYGIKNNGGTVIINNGNVTPRGEAIRNDSGSSGKGGNVIMYGGTVHSLSGRAIYNTKGSTTTITGGSVSSSFSETIYNPGGALKITGGTVSGGSAGHAIWNTDGGNVTITGGTVSLTNISGNYAAINNDSGCTVTISGGTVLAPNGGKAVINASDGTANITSPPAVIKGTVQNREQGAGSR